MRTRMISELPSRDSLSSLCVFCGCIAIIVGIVAIVKGDTMRGVLMIVIPFAIGIVLTILQLILGVGAAAVGGGAG